MKTYKSKIDLWFILVLVVAFGCPIWLGIRTKEIAPILIFSTISAIMLFWILTMRYKINDGFLSIYSTKIDINSIKRIESSRSLMSSPAFSIDRIEILYNKFDVILLSPKDKQLFVDDLLKINPNIVVKI